MNCRKLTNKPIFIAFSILLFMLSFELKAECEIVGENLIINGDFSQRNFGFYSDYKYVDKPNIEVGCYAIDAIPKLYHPGFANCKDKSPSDDNLMFFTDASPNTNLILWEQKCSILQNKKYKFKISATKIVYMLDPIIALYINDVFVKQFVVTEYSCSWMDFEVLWQSGNTNEAKITLKSMNSSTGGNDFAIDEIEFYICDCTPPTINAFPDVNICLGAEAKIGYEPNSEYNYEWITTNNIVNSDKSIATISPISSQNYVLKVTSKTGCVSYDTVFVNVEPIKKIEIKGKTTICKNSQTTLYVVEDMLEYKWNINKNNDSISVNKAGIYNVTCRDASGCLYFGEVLVNEIDSLDFSFIGDNLICDGQSGFIEVVEEFDSYLWNDGFDGKRREINQTGKYWVTVSNKNGCSATKSFTVGSFDFYLEYPDSINLGKICSLSEFSFGAYIKNPNNFSVKVDSIWMHSPNSNLLLHTDSTYNNMIKLNNIFPFTIQYKPTVAEKIQDTIYFKFSEPCNYLIKVPVSGESIENKAEIFVIDTVVFVDSKFCIPISGKMTCNLPYSMLTSYEIEVIFNKKLFLPEFVLNGEILDNKIVGNRRIVRIKQDSVFLSTDTTFLTYLCGTIMLSDSIDNIVEIGKIDWKIKDLIYETILGKIRVEHCVLPLRQIKLIENMQMQINPNPANGNFTIEISNLNDNLFELKLFDITGRTILDFSNSKFEISNNKISINVNSDNIAKGTYFINFKSNGKIIQRIIQIY